MIDKVNKQFRTRSGSDRMLPAGANTAITLTDLFDSTIPSLIAPGSLMLSHRTRVFCKGVKGAEFGSQYL